MSGNYTIAFIPGERGKFYAFSCSHFCIVAGFRGSLASEELVGGKELSGESRPNEVPLVLRVEAPDLADLVERIQDSTEANVSSKVHSTLVPRERRLVEQTEKKKVGLEVKKE